MHHGEAEPVIDMQQFLPAQPVQQHRGGIVEQHALQVGIDPALLLRLAAGNGQQREVVVTQRHHHPLAQIVQQLQGLQRLPAAVDQVAAQPEPVDSGIEAERIEQTQQNIVATLQVADRVSRHQCRVRGMLSAKGAISASNSVPSSASIR